jgi:anti-anti-sigma factor
MPEFNCEIEGAECEGVEVVLLRLVGGIYQPEDVLMLENRLKDILSGGNGAVVDLREFTYMNSLSIGVLQHMHSLIKEAGQDLVLLKPTTLVARCVRVTTAIPLYESLSEAMTENEYMKTIAAVERLARWLYEQFGEAPPSG